MLKPSPPPARNRDWLWATLLLAATFLAYRPAWNGQPLWDDAAHMTKPALRSAAGLASIWTQLGATQQYYPLTHSTFWLQYQLWGDWTVGYHLTSILLHFVSAVLLVGIVRRLGIRGAWLAGALFALHPVMVESVAWITELKNTLSGVFFFAATLAYLKFDRERRTGRYSIALLLFLLGLLSKSVVATLPAALVVILWWMRGRLSWKRDVVPLLPFFTVGAASGLFTAWVERRFIGAEGSEFSFGLLERLLVAGRAPWFYLSKLLWPAQLVFIYPRWHIDSAAAWQYLFPAALLLVAVLFWVLRNRSRAPLAVLLYFAGALFPALGFFNIYPFRYSFVADHFQYLAAAGPLVAAAACIARGAAGLGNRLGRPLQPLLAGVLLSLLFVMTWRQSRMYSDAETLYRTTLARNQDCWMAHTHLGFLLIESGRRDEAVAHMQKASQLHPNQADAHSNLGLLLMDLGRRDQAASHLKKALHLDPNHAEAHNNLGALLARDGQPDRAMAHLRKALELRPDHAEVHYNLADLLAAEGRTEDALAHYRTALQLHPQYADAHNNLGLLLVKTGRLDQAMVHLQKAVELDPSHANAHNNLGVVLARLGRADEATAHYRRAVAIDPSEPDHLENLVVALLKKGKWTHATSVLQNGLAVAKSQGDEARASAIAQSLARLEEAVGASREPSRPDPR